MIIFHGSHLTISSMAGSVFVQLQNRAKRDESSRDRDLEFYGYALCYGIMPLLCHTHAYNWSFTTAKGYLYYSSIISFTWTGHPFVIAKESLSTLRPQHQVEAICRSNLQRLLLLCGHLRTQKVLLPGNLVIISCNNLNRSRTLISMRCSTMILLYRDTSSPITTGF